MSQDVSTQNVKPRTVQRTNVFNRRKGYTQRVIFILKNLFLKEKHEKTANYEVHKIDTMKHYYLLYGQYENTKINILLSSVVENLSHIYIRMKS